MRGQDEEELQGIDACRLLRQKCLICISQSSSTLHALIDDRSLKFRALMPVYAVTIPTYYYRLRYIIRLTLK